MTAGGIVPIYSTVSTIQPGMATSTVTLALVAPSFNLLDAKHVASITLRSNGSGAHSGGAYDIIGPTLGAAPAKKRARGNGGIGWSKPDAEKFHGVARLCRARRVASDDPVGPMIS